MSEVFAGHMAENVALAKAGRNLLPRQQHTAAVTRPGKLACNRLRPYEFKARPFIERCLTRIF
jgi:hypothetical protein